MMTLDQLAKQLHAFETVDGSDFRRRARVLQSTWREEKGYPLGEHNAKGKTRSLGSRLPMPQARDSRLNYLTKTIGDLVHEEVLGPNRDPAKVYKQPRIFDDLLSSQPLAFNLFGELHKDLALCGRLIAAMTDGRFDEATKVIFEHSPGRRKERYTGDRSAFDVFIECKGQRAPRAFIGIEVKYHENLKGKPGTHKPRYDEIAREMGCFEPKDMQRLKRSPLEQIWRDHLLACSMLLAEDPKQYDDGLFVFLYPKDNDDCDGAVTEYRECLSDHRSFAAWKLERVVEELRRLGNAPWIHEFQNRYLDFDKIEARLRAG